MRLHKPKQEPLLSNEVKFRIASVVAGFEGIVGIIMLILNYYNISVARIIQVHFILMIIFGYIAFEAHIRWKKESFKNKYNQEDTK